MRPTFAWSSSILIAGRLGPRQQARSQRRHQCKPRAQHQPPSKCHTCLLLLLLLLHQQHQGQQPPLQL